MNIKQHFPTLLTITLLLLAIAMPQAQAEEKKEPNRILITNVSVWDGKSDTVKKGVDVLIEGNLIKLVGAGIDAPKAHKVDGKGGTVIPGLIDMHAHHVIHEGMLEGRNSYDQMAIGAITGMRLREYLDPLLSH